MRTKISIIALCLIFGPFSSWSGADVTIHRSGSAVTFFQPDYEDYSLENSSYNNVGGILLGEGYDESKAVYRFYFPPPQGGQEVDSLTIFIYGTGDITNFLVGGYTWSTFPDSFSIGFTIDTIRAMLQPAGDSVGGDYLDVEIDVMSGLLGGERYDLEKIQVTYTYSGADNTALEHFHTAYSAYRAINNFRTEIIDGTWGLGAAPTDELIQRAVQRTGSLCQNLSGLEGNVLQATRSFFNTLNDFYGLVSLIDYAFDYLVFWGFYPTTGPTLNQIRTACDEAAAACANLAVDYQNYGFDGNYSGGEGATVLAKIQEVESKLNTLKSRLQSAANDMYSDGADSAKIAKQSMSPLMRYDENSMTLYDSYLPNLISDMGLQEDQFVTVTINTSPSDKDLEVEVDSVQYTNGETFIWASGSSHTIEAPSPQTGNDAKVYAFLIWSDGGARIHTVAPTSDMTITANYTSTGLPYLSYNSHQIDDDTSGGSNGNGDGVVDPGETIELKVTLQNTGSGDARGIDAWLSTSDPYVTIIDDEEAYVPILSGGTGECKADYDFTVSSSCPDQHVITFDLYIEALVNDNAIESWNDSFLIIVRAAGGQAGSIVAFGSNNQGQCNVPSGNDFIRISAGYTHSLALKADGSIEAWGENEDGQCNVPSGNDFIAISAGRYHSLALRSNGSVVAWGANLDGQCNVPPGNDFVAISAGHRFSVALKADGSIEAWGSNNGGRCDVPPGNNFVGISAGQDHSLALKTDGSLEAWGRNTSGQCNVPSGNDFIAISAGNDYSLALKADGTIVGWGENDNGQATPPSGNDYIAIAAGGWHSLALKSDGLVVAWGHSGSGRCNVPAGNGFFKIAAGGHFSLALQAMVTVPDLLGLSQANAESTIAAASLTIGNIIYANSDIVPAGNVINQDPTPGSLVPLNSTVDLVVSLGPNIYTLTTSSTFGGVVTSPGEGQFLYADGTVVPIEAVADADYHFFGWTGTAVDSGKVSDRKEPSTTVTMDGDYTLEATFTIIGDFSGDGIVNFKDFSILAYYWMDYVCSEPDWCEGSDFDESETVDPDDLRRFAENWLWQAIWYSQ